jgi:hypothetical protein
MKVERPAAQALHHFISKLVYTRTAISPSHTMNAQYGTCTVIHNTGTHIVLPPPLHPLICRDAVQRRFRRIAITDQHAPTAKLPRYTAPAGCVHPTRRSVHCAHNTKHVIRLLHQLSKQAAAVRSSIPGWAPLPVICSAIQRLSRQRRVSPPPWVHSKTTLGNHSPAILTQTRPKRQTLIWLTLTRRISASDLLDTHSGCKASMSACPVVSIGTTPPESLSRFQAPQIWKRVRFRPSNAPGPPTNSTSERPAPPLRALPAVAQECRVQLGEASPAKFGLRPHSTGRAHGEDAHKCGDSRVSRSCRSYPAVPLARTNTHPCIKRQEFVTFRNHVQWILVL